MIRNHPIFGVIGFVERINRHVHFINEEGQTGRIHITAWRKLT